MNVDRTARNTNMLNWHQELWLIDHGAALYFHHSWDNWEKLSLSPFEKIRDHVLLPQASQLEETDTRSRSLLQPETTRRTVRSEERRVGKECVIPCKSRW